MNFFDYVLKIISYLLFLFSRTTSTDKYFLKLLSNGIDLYAFILLNFLVYPCFSFII